MQTKIDYCVSLIQLQEYSDEDLNELFISAGMDINYHFRAACTYYMCKMEIERRRHNSAPENMDVKCISNIFDTDHEIIFRVGRHYRMYCIDRIMLIYDDKGIPYIFTIEEEDDKCVWKCFSTWKDDRSATYYKR